MVSTELNLISIGIFGRPVGFAGDTHLYCDDSLTLEQPTHLFIEMEGLKVPFRVVKFMKNESEIKLKLESFDSKESVASLKSKRVFCEAEYVTKLEVTENVLVGYKLFNEENLIGNILEVEDHGLNSLLKVELPKGQLVYIPFHEDLIIVISEDEKLLNMKIADGLLSL